MALSDSELDKGYVKVNSDAKYGTDETQGHMRVFTFDDNDPMLSDSFETFDNRVEDEFGNPLAHGFAGPRTGISDRR